MIKIGVVNIDTSHPKAFKEGPGLFERPDAGDLAWYRIPLAFFKNCNIENI